MFTFSTSLFIHEPHIEIWYQHSTSYCPGNMNHPNPDNRQVFPGSDYHPANRKIWMAILGPTLLRVNQIVWSGTHYSATNEIGATINPHPSPFFIVGGSYAEYQTDSIYTQLVNVVRMLDIRIGENWCVKYKNIQNYPVS
ncbi:hypothetical protein ZOSMA_110G00050 [Zostera marina]|uniref:Uncharacterized protein n=1 Tax=Zostera marina TaxID=29655 RepID=A0A0K9Q3G2_ZOSMR|nr:hypothetical protein ZOSMA_110G00050 [Zostera marina]